MSQVNYSDEAWALQPWQHISYVSCHDDLCLSDRLRASFPAASDDLLLCLAMLALTPVFLGQGIPFLYAGEEVFRSKQGVRNSYNSSDEINRIDWSNLQRYPSLFIYCRELIRMRSAHRVFRMGNASLVRENLHFIANSKNVIACRLNGAAVGDDWRTVYVFMNPNKRAQHISIPEGKYTVVCKAGQANAGGLSHCRGGKVTIGRQQALILVLPQTP